ncbi:MAG: hypothetical protein K8R69_07135, partial [Deltaproteobacteria bacterium]|nr:hypothetical protein [Deltaproteobacteria bacterium]
LKRQLLGSIEYIPEPLEKTLLGWIESNPVSGSKNLIETFQGQKAALENSNDDSLYVPPAFLNQMADAYLFRHKDLSRRKLALKLGASLQKKNISIGLETLQAALSGKTQKVRKVLEEELLGYFREDGLSDRGSIEAFLKETEANGGQEVQKIEVGDLSPWADAYLMKHRGLSKRQLALRLQQTLQAKGYVYHLSSLQSVLEGKTHKTRKVIFDTLQQLLQADGLDASERVADYVNSGEGGPLEWNHYVSAEEVPNQVERLLQSHPGITRRQVALQLREDLGKKEFHFSLSTLQYLLAGKTQRIKKVVADLLENYLEPENSPNFHTVRRVSPLHSGRQALQKRVEESQSRYRDAKGAEKEELKEAFFKARWELIRKVSQKRNQAESYPAASKRRSRAESGYDESESGEGFFEGGGDSGEIPVAYGVRETVHRLVS